MEHAFANALKKGFELRDTSEFAVFCASSEKAFKIVAKPVASTAAPRGETKSSKPASAPAAEDDDDLDNMFDDSDEEDEDYFNSAEAQALAKAHQAKLDAKRKKKGTRDRTTFLFDVKPYETETDLNAMAASIKGIEHPGIQNWGQEHQLLPVAFGIKKLRLQVIVFDDAIGQDDLEDLINELHEDDVQSIDMVSVQKV